MSKPVTCEKCGMKFKGMQGLAQHRLHPVNCKPNKPPVESGTFTDGPTISAVAAKVATEPLNSAEQIWIGVNDLIILCDKKIDEWQRAKASLLFLTAELIGKQA